jgi:hypothetical protein
MMTKKQDVCMIHPDPHAFLFSEDAIEIKIPYTKEAGLLVH